MNRELLGKDQRTDEHRDTSVVICCILPDEEDAHTHTGEAFFNQPENAPVTDPGSCLGILSHPAGRTTIAGHNQSRRFLECTEGNVFVHVTGEWVREDTLLDL